MGGKLELPGRDEKNEKVGGQAYRTGRINPSGWKRELPRSSKKAETSELLLGAKGWKADILQEVNIVRDWPGKTQAALLQAY